MLKDHFISIGIGIYWQNARLNVEIASTENGVHQSEDVSGAWPNCVVQLKQWKGADWDRRRKDDDWLCRRAWCSADATVQLLHSPGRTCSAQFCWWKASSSWTSSLDPMKTGTRSWICCGCTSSMAIFPVLARPPAFSMMYAIGLPSYSRRSWWRKGGEGKRDGRKIKWKCMQKWIKM